MTTDKKKHVDLIGINTDYLQEGDNVVRKHTQEISQAFLDDLKDSRNESTKQREGACSLNSNCGCRAVVARGF